MLVAAHGRFNKILIAALRGDVARASDVEQGNTAINVARHRAEGAPSCGARACARRPGSLLRRTKSYGVRASHSERASSSGFSGSRAV